MVEHFLFYSTIDAFEKSKILFGIVKFESQICDVFVFYYINLLNILNELFRHVSYKQYLKKNRF